MTFCNNNTDNLLTVPDFSTDGRLMAWNISKFYTTEKCNLTKIHAFIASSANTKIYIKF